MSTANTEFMRDIERRFRRATRLDNRSRYKIFYCQVHPAPILALGINPGGTPSNTNPNGRTHKNGAIAAASAGYFGRNEHDILDCEWRENKGLRQLLTPLVGGDIKRIRSEVVKTNLAFRRSAKKALIDMEAAISESAPFLSEIIEVVKPQLILLTGASLETFTDHFAEGATRIARTIRDPHVRHIVFAAERATLRLSRRSVLVVQVAHASQFAWTYDRYEVVRRILRLMNA
jgi:hypothetical protein